MVGLNNLATFGSRWVDDVDPPSKFMAANSCLLGSTKQMKMHSILCLHIVGESYQRDSRQGAVEMLWTHNGTLQGVNMEETGTATIDLSVDEAYQVYRAIRLNPNADSILIEAVCLE